MKSTKTGKLAAAIALIIGASCALGAAACNKNSKDPASVKVDEAGWTAAFEKTLTCLNFTMEYSENSSYETVSPDKTSSSQQNKTDGISYITENVCHSKGTNIQQFAGKDYNNVKERISEGYLIFEDKNFYNCGKLTFKENGVAEEEDWSVNYSYSYEEKGKEQAISEIWSNRLLLYVKDKFNLSSYKDGAYYIQLNESNSTNTDYKVQKIWLKFNSDGYITYFKNELNQQYIDIDYSDVNNTVKVNSDCEIKLYGFGKTNSPTIPYAVQKTVDGYKAEIKG